MPPRTRRAIKNNLADSWHKENSIQDEKENIRSDKLLSNPKPTGNSSILRPHEANTKEEKPTSSPPKQKVELKRAGFWSKKLQDLELKQDAIEKDKSSLYEFDGTEESDSYKKKKKKIGVKRWKKATVPKQKKRIPLLPNLQERSNKVSKSEKKIKEVHRKSLFKEKIVLSKEREKLADKGEKFTFSTGMPYVGLTSTPAVNKDNFIGASNFLFLSPIINEEAEYVNGIDGDTPVRSRMAAATPKSIKSKKEASKVGTELKRLSSKRVLRSGKILGT